MSSLTSKERLALREMFNADRVTVDGWTGWVSVRTHEPRGDGGEVPWWKLIAHSPEEAREMLT